VLWRAAFAFFQINREVPFPKENEEWVVIVEHTHEKTS
jgi:hypothetical protein